MNIKGGDLKPNKSQYKHSLKNSKCTRCDQPLNNLNREQQEAHARKCVAQKKLF